MRLFKHTGDDPEFVRDKLYEFIESDAWYGKGYVQEGPSQKSVLDMDLEEVTFQVYLTEIERGEIHI